MRDLLLGKKPEEWDLTTDVYPNKIIKLFKKVVPTGIDFGTVTIIIDANKYEITTFRKDARYTDGRHPDKVKFSKTLKEDLSRRDFTINAIAYDPLAKTMIDIFNGKKDLRAKIIRCVGKPEERFAEDGLRALRACRFAAQLNFKIENSALKAIPKSLGTFKKIAVERIHDEIIKMLKSGKPSIGIEYMRQCGLLKIILPELLKTRGIKQPKPFHRYDVYWHILHSVDAAPKGNYLIKLAALLHDIAKPDCKVGQTFYNHDREGEKKAEKILKRLKFSNADIKTIKVLVNNHMFDYHRSWSDSAVRRFIRRVGKENLENLFALRLADIAAMNKTRGSGYLNHLRKRISQIIKEDDALHIRDLNINGNQIMRLLKIKPGPQVGQVLNYLLDKVLDNPALNTTKKLKELANKYAA